jgi:hypothetical protein
LTAHSRQKQRDQVHGAKVLMAPDVRHDHITYGGVTPHREQTVGVSRQTSCYYIVECKTKHMRVGTVCYWRLEVSCNVLILLKFITFIGFGFLSGECYVAGNRICTSYYECCLKGSAVNTRPTYPNPTIYNGFWRDSWWWKQKHLTKDSGPRPLWTDCNPEDRRLVLQ